MLIMLLITINYFVMFISCIPYHCVRERLIIIFIVVSSLFQSSVLFSQDHVFPSHGEWLFQNNQPFSWQNMIYKRDTIINENKYEIIGSANNKNDYAIRETPDKKVWVIYLNRLEGYGAENDSIYYYENETWYYKLGTDSSEYLLYDFGAQLNDTVEIYFPPLSFSSVNGSGLNDYLLFITGGFVPFIVSDIYYSTPDGCVNGIIRKSFSLYCYLGYNIIGPYWLEGVGATHGGPIFTETFCFFECYTQEITSTFENGWLIYPCSSNIDPLPIDSKVSIYPNRATGIISIESSKEISFIQMFDKLGRKVFESNSIVSRHFDIPTIGLSSGIYLLKIVAKDGIVTVEKLMIE